jgi:hypothetical protein
MSQKHQVLRRIVPPEISTLLPGQAIQGVCYGDAPDACSRLWEGSPGLQSAPIPINQIDMTNANKFWYEFEKRRGAFK